MTTHKALELADELEDSVTEPWKAESWIKIKVQEAATMLRQQANRIAELEKLNKDIWVGTELLNEGYDATVTTKIELFFSEEAAQQWVHEIKANPDYRPNYFWRQCEKQQIK